MNIPTYSLGPALTDEQRTFLDTSGFIVFKKFISDDEIAMILGELAEVEKSWVAQKKEKAFGIPIRYSTGLNGEKYVSRFAFASCYSKAIHDFLMGERFKHIQAVLGGEFRLGEREKDGMVVNNYVNREGSKWKQLGWHTDGLRDFFLPGARQRPLWQIGIYLDDSPITKGGLRLIPGTHKQGLFGQVFRKASFLDNRPDKDEVCVTAEKGDLTFHDGRLWHRVARATVTGEASRRRVIYLPFIDGPLHEKTENSPTPLYQRLNFLAG
ncbi:MAG: phytanoyl-CoA dioxygenase family protein [Deltaproteobacteria bacterium]|nr:phytanoyl-CoA dioxygenase family protein [Deltaproteobacteria bacterium]